MKYHVLLPALLVAMLAGCVGEATRQLNEQNYKIGLALQTSQDPDTKTKGYDVTENSRSIRVDIGAPRRKSLPYSPENSAYYREMAEEQRRINSEWWGNLFGGLGDLVLPLTGIGGVGGILLKLLMDAKGKLSTLYDGIEKVKETLPDKVTDIESVLRTNAQGAGYYKAIKKDLRKRK